VLWLRSQPSPKFFPDPLQPLPLSDFLMAVPSPSSPPLRLFLHFHFRCRSHKWPLRTKMIQAIDMLHWTFLQPACDIWHQLGWQPLHFTGGEGTAKRGAWLAPRLHGQISSQAAWCHAQASSWREWAGW
jgi:hypothetical protein